ncbi:hypothetical protein ACQUQU_04120 [Thalassolituus sp. LLYu03]|uniref:hypothetical protein n=1 Tax=Thalassolituus sp. LLYu03 TaxID=3421656 RepID=UPI003D2E7641
MPAQEAVFILHDHEVSQVLWLTELEQLVRQHLPLAKPVSGRLKAAYVALTTHRDAESLVLFELPVTQGVVDNGWHMPLRRLAEQAGQGPSLGGGRIRLACRSQCPISWHADALWEPATSDFMAIRKALRDNPLPAAPAAASAQSLNLLAETPGRITGDVGWALARRHEDPEVEELKRTLRQEMDAYRKQLQQLQQDMARQKELNARLEQQVAAAEKHGAPLPDGDEAVEAVEALIAAEEPSADDALQLLHSELAQTRLERDQLQQALAESVTQSEQAAQDMQAFQAENAARIETSKASHYALSAERDALAAQVAGLLSAQAQATEQSGAAQIRIEALEQALAEASEHSDERLLKLLEELDAVVVAFHPGAGHLTITPANLPGYLESPMGYAARRCNVGEEVYRQWLAHYDDARCLQCSAQIPRVAHPRDFSQDLHAYCKLHRRINLATESGLSA